MSSDGGFNVAKWEYEEVRSGGGGGGCGYSLLHREGDKECQKV